MAEIGAVPMQGHAKMDALMLAQKIRWEGGLWSALEYGLRAEDIADPELAAMWARLEQGYKEMAPLIDAATKRLDVAA
jgi:hypothetical protein